MKFLKGLLAKIKFQGGGIRGQRASAVHSLLDISEMKGSSLIFRQEGFQGAKQLIIL